MLLLVITKKLVSLPSPAYLKIDRNYSFCCTLMIFLFILMLFISYQKLIKTFSDLIYLYTVASSGFQLSAKVIL